MSMVNIVSTIGTNTPFIIAIYYTTPEVNINCAPSGYYYLGYGDLTLFGGVTGFGWIYSVDPFLSNASLSVFQAYVENNQYYIYDTKHQNQFLTANSQNILVPSSSKTPINLTLKADINPFPAPIILYSGTNVSYEISGQDINVQIFGYDKCTTGNTSTKATDIYLLPISSLLSADGTAPATCTNVCSDPTSCITQIFLTAPSSIYYTDVDECRNWGTSPPFFCPKNVLCGGTSGTTGTPPCNGPCQKPYDVCLPTQNNFRCIIDPEKYIEGKYFLSSWIFWLIVGIIALIILGALLLTTIIIFKKGSGS